MAETVVFVHGLYMVGMELMLLRRRLARAEFRTQQFVYRSLARGLDENAVRLKSYLATLETERLHLVAHSLGGLVVLRMFQQGVDLPPGRAVFLASPVRGSRSAMYLTEMGLGWAVGRSGPGALAEIHEPTWTEPRELGVIAGTHEFRFNALLPKLASPHDGVVSVEETRLPGAKDFTTIHSNHTGMLFRQELAEQVSQFLRHGKFRR